MPPLTTAEIADRLSIPEHRAAKMLTESERDGIVELDTAGRWALTAEAELAYGQALRGFHPTVVDADDGGPATRSATLPTMDVAA
jgi:hypothetical protein